MYCSVELGILFYLYFSIFQDFGLSIGFTKIYEIIAYLEILFFTKINEERSKLFVF